jgi:hypothetical protein
MKIPIGDIKVVVNDSIRKMKFATANLSLT